jgi:hypothetical protein
LLVTACAAGGAMPAIAATTADATAAETRADGARRRETENDMF